MEKIEIFRNADLGLQVRAKLNSDGNIVINAEDTAIGLGWTQTQTKNGKQYKSVRWERMNDFSKECGFPQEWGKDDFIPEPLFYRLGMKANNVVAETFQNWLAFDVLPTIRKHGLYATDETIEKMLSDPDFGIRLLREVKEERARRMAAEKTIEEQRPAVAFAEQVSTSTNNISLGDYAKLLNKNYFGIGRNNLMKLLRKNKILMPGNKPYQEYLNAGYFEVIEIVKSFITVPQTRITGKGQLWLFKRLQKLGYISDTTEYVCP